MSDEIDKEVDEDYIDPPKQRAVLPHRGSKTGGSAACSPTASHSENERSARKVPAAYQDRGMEMTHLFSTDAEWTWSDDIDQDAPVEQVREPGTRTVFDYREATDTERWKRLRRIQDGAYVRSGKSRGSQNSEAERKRTVQTFANQLDLTDFQQERGQAVMDSIDMKEMAHYSTRVVALAIISLVTNEDGRWIRDEGAFRQLMKEADASLRDMRKCRKLLKRKSDIL